MGPCRVAESLVLPSSAIQCPATSHSFWYLYLCSLFPRSHLSIAEDESGHTYRFNICGDVGLKCAPKEWVSLYDHGSAMQTWGDVPECDMSDPTTYCTDIEDGQAQCCSSPCQILGIGEPYFELLDRKNPETGGIRVLHQTVPAHADDPYNCPYDPDTGGFYQREMKIEIRCNSKVAGLQVQSVAENPNRPCSYTIGAQSKYGCGAKVTSAKPAKSGGKVAGAFFGGVFATLIVGAVGFYVYQRQQMGLPLLPFDNAPIGSGAAGSGSGSGSSSGAPDASFTGGAGSGGGEGAAQAGTYSSL